jgi:predicted oxidoreductase
MSGLAKHTGFPIATETADQHSISPGGLHLSPAVYGFYRWYDDADNSSANMERVVNRCLELGIYTFDHADTYGNYRCEELFGRALRRRSFKRNDIVLFTKCGFLTPYPTVPGVRIEHCNASRKHILSSVENSLRRLRTDYIDVFLLNCFDTITNLEETAKTLQELVASGKVKNLGIANFSVLQHQLLSSCLAVPIRTHHAELNLLNTTVLSNGQIDYSRRQQMLPLATSPLANGRIAEGTDAKAVRVRKKLQNMQEKYGAGIESIAVAWLMKLGVVPLVGTRSEPRIENVAAAFDLRLDHQDWYELYAASRGQDAEENKGEPKDKWQSSLTG